MAAINGIGGSLGAALQDTLRPKAATSSFENVLTDAIQKVEDFQARASQGVERFLSGEGEDLHKTVIETQRAELSFELFSQARNKVVQAYQEIMRMQM